MGSVVWGCEVTRDMDLIKALAQRIAAQEEWPARRSWGPADPVESYHLYLLMDAGLVRARELPQQSGCSDYLIDGLTWKGQEFLALASDNGRWDRLKTVASERLATLSFDVITRLLAMLAEKSIEGLWQSS
jgi:hypothetical protein